MWLKPILLLAAAGATVVAQNDLQYAAEDGQKYAPVSWASIDIIGEQNNNCLPGGGDDEIH